MDELDDYKIPYGLVAEFDTPASVLQAAEQIRDAEYARWDVHTPYSIHGMDEAMGLKNSKVGWFTFCGGCIGFFGGMLMIWYMNASDTSSWLGAMLATLTGFEGYPIPVGGKPNFSPFASFPVAYEMTILLGAFGSLGGMLWLNRLPRLHHPLLKNMRFADVTHDKFFIVIECDDPNYSEDDTRKLLKKAGATHIELVNE